MDSMNSVRNTESGIEYIGSGNGKSEVDYTKIGTKGQIIEGTIVQISDKVSIDFGGTQLTVSQSLVPNAKEGEVRNFQIMEVSKQKIVLREVENSTLQAKNGGILCTTIEANQTRFEEVLEGVSEDDEEDASQKNFASVSSRMTGEDYKEIEKEGISIESYNLKRLERALNRIKEQRLARQMGIEAAVEGQRKYDEDIQKIVLQNVVSNVIGANMAHQIANRLMNANLPVTAENIRKIANSLEMSGVVTQMSDKAMNYLINHELEPTIQNVYHAQYAGDSKQYRNYIPDYGNGYQSAAVNYEGATPREDYAVIEENWQQVKPQAEKILADAGLEVNEEALKQAKWLFGNELPITEDTLQRLDQLHTIKNEYDQEALLVDIVKSFAKGELPENVSLAKNKMEVTNQSVEVFLAEVEKQMTELEEQSGFAVDTQENIGNAEHIENITKRRQMEEIRLKMSLQAAKNLQDKGIELDINRMEEIVEELRNMEEEYYRGILHEQNVSDTPEHIEILRNTTDCVNELKQAPSYILGSTLSVVDRITLTDLKQEAQDVKTVLDRAGEAYDTLMTQPRKDLGDHMEKAFRNIDNILSELNMDATTANQRAVKILGYNGMEITEDNIFAVKEYDAQVNQLMRDLHPAVTVEMIKRGINPLNVPVRELDEQINSIKEEMGVTEEEKYSKYLWKLERQEGISQEDREAYICIYRLLNNVQKSNGAAVGQVLRTNKEMTLNNLLSAVVTAKKGQIDALVDSSTGFSELKYTREPLILELNEIFENGQSAEATSLEQKEKYFNMLVNELAEQVVPSKIGKTMVDAETSGDGQMDDFMNKNVEKLLEEWQQMDMQEELDAEYEEEMVKNIRELSDNSEKAITFLNTYKIPVTIQNLFAANQLLSEQSVFRELREKSKHLSQEIQGQTERAMDGLMDALEDKETMQEQYQRLQDSMENLLNERYAEREVTSKELSELKMLSNGMNLLRSLSSRESYEIPVLAGDSITNIHLTIISGSKDSGKVQIGMDSEQFGSVTAEFTCKEDKVNGVVLCLSKKAADTMQAEMGDFTQRLNDSGIQMGNISYGLKTGNKEYYQVTKTQSDSASNTRGLYQIAKAFVKHISALENV